MKQLPRHCLQSLWVLSQPFTLVPNFLEALLTPVPSLSVHLLFFGVVCCFYSSNFYFNILVNHVYLKSFFSIALVTARQQKNRRKIVNQKSVRFSAVYPLQQPAVRVVVEEKERKKGK